MNIKCEYCGGFYPETEAKCPNCGASNARAAQAGVPKTIEELKAFCRSKNMPLERMRFFIGEDFREPRAFGIYRNADGQFVVYKNKADGSRAVRYEGPDEAYAVNELYQKLKSEVELRREMSAAQRTPMAAQRQRRQACWIAVLLIAVAVIAFFLYMRNPRRGYYLYNDDYYYYQDSDWYYYDMDGWMLADSVDEALSGDASEYYQGDSYNDYYGVEDFSDTQYYHEKDSSSDSSWDTDYSNWDSGDTDWSRDW